MRVEFGLSLVLASAGCASDANVFIEQVWGDEPAAVVIVDAADVHTPLLIRPGEALRQFDIDARGSIRVFARTYDELDQRDLEGCDVFLAPAEGDRLGVPTQAWHGEGEAGAITLEVESPPTPFGLRIAGCRMQVEKCDVVAERIDDAPTFSSLGAVAALSDTDALIAGGPRTGDDLRTLFMRASGTGIVELPPVEGLTGSGRGLEFDGEGVVGGIGKKLFRMDENGTVTASTTLDFVIREVLSGTDGLTFILGQEGDLAYVERGALEPRTFEPAPPYGDVVPGIDTSFAVVNLERLVVAGRDNNLHLYDGGAWQMILEEAYLDLVAIDPDRVVAFQRTRPVIARTDDELEWHNIGTFFRDQPANSVVSIGDGRFLTGGQDGILTYFNGRVMCQVATATARNFVEVDLAPSGRVAFAVLQNYEGTDMPTPIYRITLP